MTSTNLMNVRKCLVFGLGMMLVLLVGTAMGNKEKADADAEQPADKSKKTESPKTDPKKETRFFEDQKDEADEEAAGINPDLYDEYAEMAKVAKLDKKQQEKLLAIQNAKEAALEKWDQKNEKKLVRAEDTIERTKSDKKRERLELQLKKFEARRKALAAKHDRMALGILKKEQIIVWNGHRLWEEVSLEFEFLDLDEHQQAKGKEICNKIAGKIKGKRPIAGNEKVRQVAIVRISKKVLTPEQRKEFAREQRKKKREQEREKKRQKNTRTRSR